MSSQAGRLVRSLHSHPRRLSTAAIRCDRCAGFAATEAGATAFLAATGLKYVFGRARPGAGSGSGGGSGGGGSAPGEGSREFKPFTSAAGFDALPSRHAAVAWAVATPFALEYHAPWLYGIAAVTNLARVGSREH